ncbi:MAG: Rieske 2Fe-2S domain-containing protein [Proteobacteria bacterium]|nr:Rieske 2Fe-2S domain-containing protein [Pseudomonadota bacterium]MBI3497062.1 Rieske 2Fe-2S domain-containing protein [Pseudomonadota bacterium]
MSLLCRLDDLPEGATRGFAVEREDHRTAIFLVNWAGVVHGYVNSCPHVGTPLDWLPDRFLSPDDSWIMCATHGALFRPEDGFCIAGPCAGLSLERVKLSIVAGEIRYNES